MILNAISHNLQAASNLSYRLTLSQIDLMIMHIFLIIFVKLKKLNLFILLNAISISNSSSFSSFELLSLLIFVLRIRILRNFWTIRLMMCAKKKYNVFFNFTRFSYHLIIAINFLSF